MKVRPEHMANVLASDRLEMAGALADDFPDSGVPDFKGSAVIVKADSKPEVLEFLKKDIYVEAGVWDVENAQIYAVCQVTENAIKMMKEIRTNI